MLKPEFLEFEKEPPDSGESSKNKLSESATNVTLKESIKSVHLADILQAENRLNENTGKSFNRERELLTLLENSPDIIVRYDRNMKRIYANRTFIEQTGFSKGEAMGVPFFDKNVLPESTVLQFKQVLLGVFTSGKPSEKDFEWTDAQNVFHCFSIRTIPEFDPHGQLESVMAIARDITESKKTENSLREAQNKLSALISAIPDLVWLKDKDGVYQSCNKAFQEFFRAKESEIVGKTDYAFVKKEVADFFREKDREAIEAGKVCITEEDINYAGDGRRGILETRKVPLYNTNGEIEGVFGIARDITERINTEKALRESEEKFSSAFRNSPSAFAIISFKDDTIIDANESFCKLTGYDREELIGNKAGNLKIFAYSEKFFESPNAFYRNGNIKNVEFHFQHRNGFNKCGLISAVKIKVGGNLSILFQVIDITRRKRTEKKLLEERFKLSEAQRIGHIGSWEYNFDTHQITFSSEINRIYELDPERTTSNYTRFLERVHSEDRDLVFNTFKNSIIHHIPCIVEHRIVLPNGKVKYVFQHSETFYDASGRQQRMIGTVQDITFKKVAELELLEAKEKAEENNRLKSAFLATMNHELRTPLNHIIGFSDLIIHQPERASDFVKVIKSSGQKLLDIVEDIFQLALAEQSEIILRNDTFNLGSMFADSAQVLQEILEISGKREAIELRFSPDDFLLNSNVFGDLNKINQVLGNLFKNAVKFTEKGFIEFGMTSQIPGRVTFFVRDTGVGIAKEKHPVIFEFFRQGDDSHTRKHGGVGVGLAISKRITEVLNGSLTFVSEPLQGSTFYFNIPIKEVTL